MSNMMPIVRVQIRRLWAKKEFWIAFASSMVFVSIGFVELCLHFMGADRSAVPTAAAAWVANMDSLLIYSMHLYFFLFIFILSSMAFGDALYLDATSGHVQHMLSRCSVRTYVMATALVAFAAGFLVVALPLALSQALSFLVFPVSGEAWQFSGNLLSPLQDYTWIRSHAAQALFPDLLYEAPYAYNLVFIVYDSLWGGLAAVVSIAVSCCVRKSRLVVVGAPTFVFLLTFFLFTGAFPLQYYLYPNTVYVPLSPLLFLIAPLIVGGASVAVLLVRSSRRGDLFL